MAKSKSVEKRKQTIKWSFQRNVFHNNKHELIKWIKQSEVQVRCHSTGSYNDGTEFIQITIEGFKP